MYPRYLNYFDAQKIEILPYKCAGFASATQLPAVQSGILGWETPQGAPQGPGPPLRGSGGFLRGSGGFLRGLGGFPRGSGGFLRALGGYLRSSGGFLRGSGGFLSTR